MNSIEKQTVEWKRTWQDEYLKWVCAFANSQGGILDIGKDNAGRCVGITNPQRLLEDIPNKIRNALGIIADVTLEKDGDTHFIRIAVTANPYPISSSGKYYARSGSTTQELTGRRLDEFILRRQGKTWDGVPVPNVSLESFDRDAFNAFRRKAVASSRMNEEDLRIGDALLLDNLRLTESGYLKRAAILLFHQEPERWFTGASVKIGQFRNAADLESQDEVHGPLMTMPDKVVDLVYLKYFRGRIAYSGIQRTETYPIPRAAFREAVLNAIVHKDYSTGNPIHIHIYPDKVLIYNDGRLPENWTEADLLAPHTSKPFNLKRVVGGSGFPQDVEVTGRSGNPDAHLAVHGADCTTSRRPTACESRPDSAALFRFNPDIANGFFRAGLIEAWGRGIEKIETACRQAGVALPHYRIRPNEVMIGFDADISDAISDSISDAISDAFSPNQTQKKIITLMRENPSISATTIASVVRIATRNVNANIKRLKEAGLLERIGSPRKGRWIVK